MASSFQYLLLLLLLFASSSSSSAKLSFRPKALVLPVTKDDSTLQYITHIHQRTPLVPLNLVLDLGGQNLWVDCEQHYTSSTYRPARCNSAVCSAADFWHCAQCFEPPRPGCTNNTCTLLADNPLDATIAVSDVGQDLVSVQSTNGFYPGQNVSVSRFVFGCAPNYLLRQLADGASGMAGLGRTKISAPSQFSSAFSFPRKFAICLASHSKGVVFFGDGPYVLLPDVDAAKFLIYTPLILNPVSTASIPREGKPSSEYFIGVKSIKIEDKVVPNINKNLLSINKEGFGGTKISTLNPFTVLESSIFKAVTEAFISARNYTRVVGVAPFEACFSSNGIGSTRLGPAVPTIELVLQNDASWSIFGANSVVQVKDDVMCLGVVNGGAKPRTAIVIGGFQLENHLVQFDLASSRLGFSPLLFWRRTTCANFNFTSAAGTAAVLRDDLNAEFENKMSFSVIE
ncbi:basic 7S globulin-like [Neltuma alba]|uniref:basic 7S globulin-like n=1 Tax=Neltuma alba TaxID=207710 RepID=UPI0010A41549|nr:basic 7S globulin-like [Prosopis alba]